MPKIFTIVVSFFALLVVSACTIEDMSAGGGSGGFIGGDCTPVERVLGQDGLYLTTVTVQECADGPRVTYNDLSIIDCWAGRRLILPGAAWGPSSTRDPFSLSMGVDDIRSAAVQGQTLDQLYELSQNSASFSQLSGLNFEQIRICRRI